MFNVATLVLIITIMTPDPYTHSKQSKTIHAKCNLKKMSKKTPLKTKSDCITVADLNHAVRHLCHVAENCSKLLECFRDYYLFNMSGQLDVGIVLIASDSITTKK